MYVYIYIYKLFVINVLRYCWFYTGLDRFVIRLYIYVYVYVIVTIQLDVSFTNQHLSLGARPPRAQNRNSELL